MTDKIYFNSIRGKKSNFGIKLSGKVEDVINEIRQYANEKGYINIELKERKEADKYGNTHYCIVDTYEPKTVPQNSPKDDLPF